jgi:hypothetical protein
LLQILNGLKKNIAFQYLLIGIFLVPVVFLNLRSSHDWGDDFAGYILQAKCIAGDSSAAAVSFIENPSYPGYAPQSYPSGFPVLLSAVYAVSGVDIYRFELMISLFLFGTLMLMFSLLKRNMNSFFAALMVILFAYNPWTLNFKSEVMSDIPFSFFLLLAIVLYQKKSQSVTNIVLLILVTGFMIAARTAGIAFLIAIIIHGIYSIRMKNNEAGRKSFTGKYIFIPVAFGSFAFYLILQKIFSCGNTSAIGYRYIFDFHLLKHFILTNLSYYMAVMRAFFEPWNGEWQFAALIGGTLTFAFILLGMIRKFATRIRFTDILFLSWMMIILVYPYTNAGFRFLFPVAPILFQYGYQGMTGFDMKGAMKPKTSAIIFSLIILLSYRQGWTDLYNSKQSIPDGPYQKENVAMFDFIKTHLPHQAIFCFAKPRAMALYAGRRAFAIHPEESNAGIKNDLQLLKTDYLLINNEASPDNIKSFSADEQPNLIEIYRNSRNVIYKIMDKK